MAKPSQAKTPNDPEGSDGSALSSARPADPVPVATKTDPDLVRDHEIIPAAPVEFDSAPPSIPSAASVTAEDAPKPQGAIPVLPGHVIANRYEVMANYARSLRRA